MPETEILIIGGGIAGASTALHLAEAGRSVTLLERGEIAGEASGVNMGGIGSLGWGNLPDLEAHLTMGSLQIFKRLQLEMGYDIEFRQSGALTAIQTDAEFDYARDRVDNLRSLGYEIELLSVDEVRSIEPEVSPELHGFTYSPLRSQADPVKSTQAFAAAAEREGARILTGHEVSQITASKADGTYVVSAGGTEFHAGTLVLAAGAWCDRLGAMMGLRIPIFPVRGQMWATDSLPPRLFQTMSATESPLQWSQSPGNDDATPPELTHQGTARVTRHLYGRQRRNGEIIFGGDRQLVDFDDTPGAQGIEVNRGHAIEVLPFLRDIPIKRTWGGIMPFSIDGKPIIGKIPHRANLYIVSGLCSSGFGRGPMAGKLLADYIHTGHMPQVLTESDPARCVNEVA
ncbi:MAG: FAD-binding oxidoreductase [Chloroflexi bacterium]|nr:FAD-binding oxidoreductase [Chloroflexota bacterium]